MSGTVIARSPCGDYSEDTLTAWKTPDGVMALERETKEPARARQWSLRSTDRLRVTGNATGDGRMIIMESQLAVVAPDGGEIAIAHFEFDLTSGGVTHDDVAALARTIAHAAGCAVTVEPLVIPEHGLTRPAPVPTVAPELVPVPPALSPRETSPPLVGTELAILGAGTHAEEPIRAVRLLDGTVMIENTKTGARWSILRDDTLEIAPFVNGSGSAQGVWTYLDRVRATTTTRIADFAHWDDGDRGPDEKAVTGFVATIAAASACKIVHRALVWP